MRTFYISLFTLIALAFYASGTKPLAKADAQSFSNFNARWGNNAIQLERMERDLPDTLRNALNNRAAKGN